jgi:hypothetical protein
VTNVADGHVPDEVFASARDHFSEDELVNLTIAVIATNSLEPAEQRVHDGGRWLPAANVRTAEDGSGSRMNSSFKST